MLFYRRLCPGLHLADSAVWHIMASILATMDIKKAIDAEGKPIEPQQVYNNSIFRYDFIIFLPYGCSFLTFVKGSQCF